MVCVVQINVYIRHFENRGDEVLSILLYKKLN